jgi:hypothetical protein
MFDHQDGIRARGQCGSGHDLNCFPRLELGTRRRPGFPGAKLASYAQRRAGGKVRGSQRKTISRDPRKRGLIAIRNQGAGQYPAKSAGKRAVGGGGVQIGKDRRRLTGDNFRGLGERNGRGCRLRPGIRSMFHCFSSFRKQ